MPQILISFFNVYANRILLSRADLCCSRNEALYIFPSRFHRITIVKIVTRHLFRKIFYESEAPPSLVFLLYFVLNFV